MNRQINTQNLEKKSGESSNKVKKPSTGNIPLSGESSKKIKKPENK